jgi:hypothetical protein
MALLTAITTPTPTGAVYTTQSVSASDTIPASALGARGCLLFVINGGGSPDSVGVVDGSNSPAGNLGQTLTNSVTNGTTEIMFIPQATVNLATQVTTITHTFTTSVTCAVVTL